MRCVIGWNNKGETTYHDDPAVGLARVCDHGGLHPICRDHLLKMPRKSYWSFTPFPGVDLQVVECAEEWMPESLEETA